VSCSVRNGNEKRFSGFSLDTTDPLHVSSMASVLFASTELAVDLRQSC
jgi:hypothetical protein